ncbi:MAG TPA: serine hydrolase domain-containing protein [Kofleriaceae bacterium]|jgi:CubicO group peptidase (beta-lactamase class C family)
MRAAILIALLAACHRDRLDEKPLVESAAPSELETFVSALATAAPAVQIVVEQHGKVILDRAYGVIDIENQVPATPDSVFAIGSISKQFGAAAIMQLVEAGRLSLDDKLAKWMPTFPRADRITLRQLLQHTTGIVDFEYNGTWPTTMGVARTTDEVIATFRDLPPLFEPGTRWAYSSSNYVLVGAIVEKVSGQSLADYLAQHVFLAANLTHTRMCDSYAIIPHRARGYVLAMTTPVSPTTTTAQFVPAPWSHLTQFGLAGGICSTARDLLTWQHALEAGKVVSAASYRLMITPGELTDGTQTHYGLGLSQLRFAGHARIMHSGGVSGFVAELEHFTDDDLRIAIVSNAESGFIAPSIVTHLLHIAPARAVPIPEANLEALRTAVLESPSEGTVHFELAGDRIIERDDGGNFEFLHIGDLVFETRDHVGRLRFEVTNGVVTRVFSSAEDSIETMYPKPLPAP